MLIIGVLDMVLFCVGYFLVDINGGMVVVMFICVVLNVCLRGVFLDVFMMDLVIFLMGWVVLNYLIGGVMFVVYGNENIILVLLGIFVIKD